MLLKVWVAEWVLEEDDRTLEIGEELTSWLDFTSTQHEPDPDRVNAFAAQATPLPSWPGQGWGKNATRLDVGGTALYWDAPHLVSGPVELEGIVEYQRIDAPPGFPQATGQVRRLRLRPFGVLVDVEYR